MEVIRLIDITRTNYKVCVLPDTENNPSDDNIRIRFESDTDVLFSVSGTTFLLGASSPECLWLKQRLGRAAILVKERSLYVQSRINAPNLRGYMCWDDRN